LTEFIPQNGFRISGQLVNPDNHSKPIIGQVSLNKWDNIMDLVETETDSLGHFSFEKLELYDTTWLILQATKTGRKKTKKISENAYISIILDKRVEFIQPEKKPIEELGIGENKKLTTGNNSISLPELHGLEEKYIAQWKKIMKVDSVYNPNMSFLLDEIQITSQRERREDPFYRGSLHGEPSDRLVMDSLGINLGGQTVFSIVSGRFAGVQVQGSPPNQQLIIQGQGSINSNNPLYLLDGIQVDAQTISAVYATDVSHVEVIKGPDAAIYGSNGANGVLAVYTKDGFIRGPSRVNVKKIPFKGYSIPREFYTPNYGKRNPDHVKPDFRTTLYWNNEVILTPEKTKNLSFYTSDDSKKYIIRVQGITYNGLPIYSQSTITIQ
ncbi:MAG: TonB-dependent receptor plug domain-containing protein, partial [Cyclobacteriaceae bacterium]